jgi:hypothetical protein
MMMNQLTRLVTLAVGGLLATLVQADLAEFNAINSAARAARERGDNAALLANMRKMAAIAPGHPAIEIALARGLALDETASKRYGCAPGRKRRERAC